MKPDTDDKSMMIPSASVLGLFISPLCKRRTVLDSLSVHKTEELLVEKPLSFTLGKLNSISESNDCRNVSTR